MRVPLTLLLLALLAPTAMAGIEEKPLPNGWRGPVYLAFDKQGNLWMTLDDTWALARYDPRTGAGQAYPLPAPKPDANAAMGGIGFTSNGMVWTGTGTHLFGLNPANGSYLAKRLPEPAQLGGELYVAPDDSIYYAIVDQDEIVHLDTRTGQIETLPLPSKPFGPIGFTPAANGGVLLTATYANALATYDPVNSTLDLAAQGVQGPVGVARAGPDAYVAEMGANSISHVKLPTSKPMRFTTSPSAYYPTSGPAGILVARDGSVWFAEHFSDRISRFDPENLTLHEYEVPSAPGSNVQHVAQDANGRVWFAEYSTSKIGIATFTNEPVPDALANLTIAPGQRLEITLPATQGALLAMGPDETLNATIQAGKLVLVASPKASGEQYVLLTTNDGKDHHGRYVHVQVEAAKGTPAPGIVLALLALVGVALLRRARR